MKIGNTTLIEGTKSITRKITSIRTRGRKLDADIHTTALSCVYHAEQHGDVTLAERLMDSMPNGSRVKSLAVWLEDFFPMSVKKDKESGNWKVSLKKDRSAEDYQYEKAEADPFWQHSVERDPRPLTVEQVLAAAITRLGKVEDDQAEFAAKSLSDVLAKVKAEHEAREAAAEAERTERASEDYVADKAA